MKVAITDYTFPDLDIERSILEAQGCEIVAGQCKTPEALIDLTTDADYVITQFAPIDASVINALQKAKIIVRYGIGYDNVDCDASRTKQIPVCNIPDYCIDEVADHTLAFILSMTRSVRANCRHMMRGNWGVGVELEQMRTLRDQTVGILGLGRIGKAVVTRLRGFGGQTLASDPVVSAEDASSLECTLVELDTLLATSDIVTLHCPSNEHTRNVINRNSLQKMKAGAILINVGRGDLVDLAALTEALQSEHIAAAALDVFNPEPLAADSPLLQMDNVIVSSHIASASPKATRTLRETAANLVVTAIQGKPLPNVVNDVN